MITKRTITQWVLLVKEREETEVKKDIGWFKDEAAIVLREVFNNHALDYVKYIEVKRQLEALLDQLNETEVLSQGEIINIVLDDLKEHIKEQQSLSQNVGMAHTPAGNDTHYRQYDYVLECINEYEPSEDLQKLLVPEQELPTIPQFVSGWIEETKKQGKSYIYAIAHIYDKYETDESLSEEENRIFQWMEAYDNDEVFARAWLDGYTVEEEQKYHALIKGHENIVSDDKYWNYCITDESLDIGDNKVHTDVLAEYVLSATKDDWENLGINDGNADFVKVGELEE